jgi:CubicO group peptidase (beta-lactamase class C family)
MVLVSAAVAAAACVAAGVAVSRFGSDDAWASLRAGLDAWAALDFDVDFAVNVGTADGEQFVHATEGFTMQTMLAGASLSKWPAATMISGLVNDGILSYADKANKYLKFWATDPADSRSNVTLLSLMSFTSGYTADPDELFECVRGSQSVRPCTSPLRASHHPPHASTPPHMCLSVYPTEGSHALCSPFLLLLALRSV